MSSVITGSGSRAVRRGAGWSGDPRSARVADRRGLDDPANRVCNLGLRLVRTVPAPL